MYQEIVKKLEQIDFKLKFYMREDQLNKALITSLERKIELLEEKIKLLQTQHID